LLEFFDRIRMQRAELRRTMPSSPSCRLDVAEAGSGQIRFVLRYTRQRGSVQKRYEIIEILLRSCCLPNASSM
jgi:hypothetical protein